MGGLSSHTLTRAPLFSRISRIETPPGPISLPARCVGTYICICMYLSNLYTYKYTYMPARCVGTECRCAGVDVSGGSAPRTLITGSPFALAAAVYLATMETMSSTATCTRSIGPWTETPPPAS